MRHRSLLIVIWMALSAAPLRAGEATVAGVDVRKTAPGVYHFDVTVSHADTGWSHYADRFEVLTPDGTVLGTRVLYHPHVGEQPFTRGLSDVVVPDDVHRVIVRAHDSVHGDGDGAVTLTLP